MTRDFIKFSTWIKMREEAAATTSGPAVAGGSSAPVSDGGITSSPSETGSEPSSSNPEHTDGEGTTTKDKIATRPFVLGCGYCYPVCGCGNKKRKKKKKKTRKGKKK